MKLLTPSQNADVKASELQRELLRSKEFQKVADDTRKRLANAEADFSLMLASQRKRWEQELFDHDKLVGEMVIEVNTLEQRRQNALIPAKLDLDKAADTLLKAQETLESARTREEGAEALSEALQDKLDFLGAREADMTTREQRAFVKEQNIELIRKQSEQNAKEVSAATMKFLEESARRKNELDNQETALTLRERSVEAGLERITQKEKELTDWSVRLQDERAILDREYIRKAKRKK